MVFRRQEDEAAETIRGDGGEADVGERVEDGVEGGGDEGACDIEGAGGGGEEDG